MNTNLMIKNNSVENLIKKKQYWNQICKKEKAFKRFDELNEFQVSKKTITA